MIISDATLGFFVVAVVATIALPFALAWASRNRWQARLAEWFDDRLWRVVLVVALAGAGPLLALAAVAGIWQVLFPPGPQVSAWTILVTALLVGLFISVVLPLVWIVVSWVVRRRSDEHR